ncbi:MAG: UDP-N-acetylmuramoylalanine--D-glutamate ligase [Myxococcota bacterium]
MSRVEVDGKRVVVLGLGRSGRAAARLAARLGARVVGVDQSSAVAPIEGVELRVGGPAPEVVRGADLLIVSPGVPPPDPTYEAAREAGTPIVGELGFARALLPTLPCVGITGTNGKSTVTTFVGDLLRCSGFTPFVGGNLGEPLSSAVGGAADVLVVEVSSYQLERPGGFRPNVGVILNLTPDHLGRHGTMAGYAGAKARLFESMRPDDLAILPLNVPLLADACGGHAARRACIGAHPGLVRTGMRVTAKLDAGATAAFDLSEFAVPGVHNLDNAAVALFLAWCIGASPGALQLAIPRLAGLPHRLEVVRDEGVRWIDDSKATNVEATLAAVGGLDRQAVVLLGGQAKGPGFAALAAALAKHRAVLTFGASGPAISEELARAGVSAPHHSSLDAAVRAARGLAQPGDAILLSPGCASFDAFSDFTERGRFFRALAHEEAP